MDLATTVCQKLDLSTDELNSLYVTNPVNGFTGSEVAGRLANRFGLAIEEPLGVQLAALGILTDEEAAYLDDAD